MWAMNAVDYATRAETAVIETTDEDGNPTTTEITETVLVIELTHKTPDEMAADYHFTTRQNSYLQLLQDPQYGNCGQNCSAVLPGRWRTYEPGQHRTPQAPCSGRCRLREYDYLAVRSPCRPNHWRGQFPHWHRYCLCRGHNSILAAADGTVTVANSLDSWGGSYGYYIQIDHGGGLETLYAHCSSICVTTDQQVQAGQVIGYVGHTGRATGSHFSLRAI